MDNNTYKRYAQGLLSVPEEKRIEEVQKLLDMLSPCKHEDDGMTYISYPPRILLLKS